MSVRPNGFLEMIPSRLVHIHDLCVSRVLNPSMIRIGHPYGKDVRLFTLLDVMSIVSYRVLRNIKLDRVNSIKLVRESLRQSLLNFLTLKTVMEGKTVEDGWLPPQFVCIAEEGQRFTPGAGNTCLDRPGTSSLRTLKRGQPLSTKPLAGFLTIDLKAIVGYSMEQLVAMKSAGTLAGLVDSKRVVMANRFHCEVRTRIGKDRQEHPPMPPAGVLTTVMERRAAG